ncbi:transferase 1, rSAM/selenodomain-associated [Leptospira yanagawae serovar Saopaulo str. Sao Paulo = ATCC 700523]|uniref:Transferase 1, rSAM/selenodomain-associated n=1 Tax=Leptospira yanagawae serovar Saopaulo str. Sao Paulo = ATCC 700523 TaxID=1249483 RepID=A0A5E8H996_9LEPT|nr:TIGR04282 family arsenosugar biosynthesis glycosyltransferase [Leptospira yanagawae]EOQ87297.1 transferase 1, rSAM/selenodomain-associated [Leptospira yanagawae serovar Saopaulo str. Sao Paulo = ATCC 700523]
MSEKKLIIFAKQPKLGQVKTRLAHAIGDTKALDVYEELLQITESVTSNLDADKIVYWDQIPELPNPYFTFGFRHFTQTSGDLGSKMANAFQNEFQESNGKVLIIGTDCPYLNPSIFSDAYKALDHSDFVIGPAIDGGYYLLGMKEYLPFVFRGIPWSTESVLKLTLEAIKKNHFRYSLLKELDDIDTVNEWEKWKEIR